MASNRRGKGEGSIYQRADGYWVGSCEVGRRWSETAGKMVRRQSRVVRKSRADVVTALDDLRRQVAAGVVPDRTVTVERYLTWWLDNVLGGNVSPVTLKARRTRATRWVIPYVGTTKLAQLRPAHVAQMMAALAAQGFKASTRSDALRLLRQACEFAVTDGVLMRNPTDGVRAPDVEPKTNDTPTTDEAKALLTAAETDRLGIAAHLTLTYGLRSAELRKLSWDDIDDAGNLTVRREHAKTQASARTFPLLDETRTLLAAHRKAQAAERLAAPLWVAPDAVITDEKGRRLTTNTALAWWHDLCGKAGVPRRRLHSARHYAATRLFELGVDIETVSSILGHRDVAITRRVYLRITEDMKRKALRKLA